MIIGSRKEFDVDLDDDFDGFDGTIKNPSFNGFSISLWNIEDSTLEEQSQVPENMELLQKECYNVQTGEIKPTDFFGKKNYDRHTCICLSGGQSYAKLAADIESAGEHEQPISLMFHQKLEIHTQFQPTQENNKALVALMFNEDEGAFVLIEQVDGMMILKMRPSFDQPIETIEGLFYS